jgi:hypothetical protein
MSKSKLGTLVLPAALAVSSFVLASACSDDESTEEAGLPACSEVMDADCTKCVDSGGDVNCAGQPSDPDAVCLYSESSDECDEAIA